MRGEIRHGGEELHDSGAVPHFVGLCEQTLKAAQLLGECHGAFGWVWRGFFS